MRTNLLAGVALLTAFGCVGSVDSMDATDESPDLVGDSARPVAEAHDMIGDDPDICSLLPSCGPCSLACDPEKLAQEYVPKGTCALFSCTLTDGRTIRVDACNVGCSGPMCERTEPRNARAE